MLRMKAQLSTKGEGSSTINPRTPRSKDKNNIRDACASTRNAGTACKKLELYYNLMNDLKQVHSGRSNVARSIAWNLV